MTVAVAAVMAVTDLDHRSHMRRAFELARAAGERGDEPFGAVLVDGESVVAEASNAVHTGDDIALHPELTLARAAGNMPDADELVLYSSTEPCSMCAGGIAIADLRGVVYSVSAARAADVAGERGAVVPAPDLLEALDDTTVVGGVLEAAGERIHREYW